MRTLSGATPALFLPAASRQVQCITRLYHCSSLDSALTAGGHPAGLGQPPATMMLKSRAAVGELMGQPAGCRWWHAGDCQGGRPGLHLRSSDPCGPVSTSSYCSLWDGCASGWNRGRIWGAWKMPLNSERGFFLLVLLAIVAFYNFQRRIPLFLNLFFFF